MNARPTILSVCGIKRNVPRPEVRQAFEKFGRVIEMKLESGTA